MVSRTRSIGDRRTDLFVVDVSKSERNLITGEQREEVQQLKEKVNRILTIISRDHMKVVFFGR